MILARHESHRRRSNNQVGAEKFTHWQQSQCVKYSIRLPYDPFLQRVMEVFQGFVGRDRGVKIGHLERLGLLYVYAISVVGL